MKIKSDYVVAYHGTSFESAKSIRKIGFKLSKKVEGATQHLFDKAGSTDREASRYHYITTSLKEAAGYAKHYKNPEIVRVICPDKWFKDRLEKDPQSSSGEAYRTKRSISKSLILPTDPAELTDKKVSRITKKIYGKKNSQFEDLKKNLGKITKLSENDEKHIKKAICPIQEAKDAGLNDLDEVIKRVDIASLEAGMIFSLYTD